MSEKETFYKDAELCTVERTHLDDHITDSGLIEIDKLFGDADALSLENYRKTNKYRIYLIVCGILVTLSFILYDELETNLIFRLICIVSVIVLVILSKTIVNKEHHRKHLQYRVLAESLRAQFFISYAGFDEKVADMLPWIIKHDMPWVIELLKGLPKVKTENKYAPQAFCKNQREYHEEHKKSDKFYSKANVDLNRISLYITIILYIVLFVFDAFVVNFDNGSLDLNLAHFIIKLLLGVMTAITLFSENLFGKVSSSIKVDEHKRRLKLYCEICPVIVENMYDNKEITKENFLYLIHEFLIENSTWYVYESQNKLRIAI